MAKREATAPTGVRVILTPRALLWYHMGGEYSCWHPGIGWFELHQYPREEGRKLESPQLKYFHFMHSDILVGAIYHRFPGSEKRHVTNMASTVRTTAQEFEDYLRKKVWTQKTATAEVFKYLGLKKPKQPPVVANAETNEHLNELYARAAKVMGLDEEEVRKKYSHLNPGLQAMNLRNRLRARGQTV
jgi:hypothetical protein